MTDIHRGVLILGPIGVGSGIASVIETVLAADTVQKDFHVTCIRTSVYKDGNLLSEVGTVVSAYCTFLAATKAGQGETPIVHLHSSSGISFYRKAVFALLARRRGCPVIWHLHASRFDDFFGSGASPRRRCVVGWVLRRADRVIVLCEKWKRDLRWCLAEDRVTVVRNPVQILADDSARVREPLVGNTQETVLFMGFLRPEKGIFDLLAVAEAVLAKRPLLRFRILGKGPSYEDLRSASLRSSDLHERFQLAGWVRGRAKQEELSIADLFVLPSYYEGVPIALLEAMAAGLPVVSTTVGGIPEVVQDGVNGLLVEPGDRPALQVAIEQLLDHVETRRSMATANRRAVLAHSPDEVAQAWLTVYRSMGAV